MVEFQVIHADGVPALLRPASRPGAPIVLLYHGFGHPASEQEMAQAFPLDELDANVAYVGLPLFGERLPPGGLDEVMDRQARDYLRQLLMPVVDQAVNEMHMVIAEVVRRTEADRNAVALMGFSAGGVIVAAALIRNEVLVRAAVLVNTVSSPTAGVALYERLSGTNYPWDDDAHTAALRADLAAHATAVATYSPPPAVLILHGTDDEYAAPNEIRELHCALSDAYAAHGHTGLIELRFFDHVAHNFTGANRPADGLSPAGPLNDEASRWLSERLTPTS
jgi:predicted esterase